MTTRTRSARDSRALPALANEQSRSGICDYRKQINFAAVNTVARANLLQILERWLPGGQHQGNEYVALNPNRQDRHLGSFRINLRTGRRADFATDDRGGDVISLAAFLFGLTQAEAARKLAEMLAVNDG